MRFPVRHVRGRAAWPFCGFELALVLCTPKIAGGQSQGEPGSRAIAGVVHDTTGQPIEGVEGRVGGRQLALTDSAGIGAG